MVSPKLSGQPVFKTVKRMTSNIYYRLRNLGLAAAFVLIATTSLVAQEQGVPNLPPHIANNGNDIEFEANSSGNVSVAGPANAENIVGTRRLLEIVRNGGPLMIPIGVCSFILLIFIFERAIALRKGRIIPGPFSRRFIEQLKERELTRDKAIQLCENNQSVVADLFKAAAVKWGRPSVEIEQAVMDAGERVSNELRKYLRLINGIATVCPLLGLLGTVIGMIHAFDAIGTVTGTSADPKALIATGISQALLTTAAGMSVAIPAIIAYLFFTSRVDKRIMELDSLGQQVVNYISAESGSGSRRTSTKTKKAAA